jgi:Golgi apparatus protein 1
MIIRAKSINLLPEVQEACYSDLSRLCMDANVEQKGEEMRCLQVNLKNLEDDCQKAVSKYTERESKDVRLDQILMRACEPIMNSYCADKKDGKGDLLECLIKQKNNKDIDAKCRMGIEHHQLLNMQNVNFNYKFKRACRKEIADHCASSNSKIEVVRLVLS